MCDLLAKVLKGVCTVVPPLQIIVPILQKLVFRHFVTHNSLAANTLRLKILWANGPKHSVFIFVLF